MLSCPGFVNNPYLIVKEMQEKEILTSCLDARDGI